MCCVGSKRGYKRTTAYTLGIVISKGSDGRRGIVDIRDLTDSVNYDKTNETSSYVEYERRELKRIMKQVGIQQHRRQCDG